VAALRAAPVVAVAAPARRGFVLALLFGANVINYIDRQIVTILQDPIKADLGLSDTQLGLLTGLSFALFYATLGVPIARLADRHRRSRIIAVSIALWSVMTALCAAAGSFATLLLCRIGVGVGEAGLSPSAHSLITDTYEPRRRAAALAVYSAGIQIGVMLGFLLAGWIHSMFGWREAFFAVGLAGLPIALLCGFLIPEPQRGRFDAPETRQAGAESLPGALRQIWANRPCRFAILACGFHAIVLYGHGHWAPPFLGRIHGMALRDIALALALLASLCGGLGIWISGLVADRANRSGPGGSVRVAGWSLVALIPCELGYVLSSTTEATLAFSVLTHFLGGFYLAPMIAFAHERVGPSQRALASALLLLSINLVGLGIGPLAVGWLSDTFSAAGFGTAGLRYALLAVMPAQLAALALFGMALASLKHASPAKEPKP
jgi:MFS family permease